MALALITPDHVHGSFRVALRVRYRQQPVMSKSSLLNLLLLLQAWGRARFR